jgi:hypothetical protein
MSMMFGAAQPIGTTKHQTPPATSQRRLFSLIRIGGIYSNSIQNDK